VTIPGGCGKCGQPAKLMKTGLCWACQKETERQVVIDRERRAAENTAAVWAVAEGAKTA